MKTVDYEEWKKRRQVRFAGAVGVENRIGGRKPGNRPRDAEKERILIRLEMARRRRFFESGKLRIAGPRLWEWRTDIRADG
jgi:hypothetical protein